MVVVVAGRAVVDVVVRPVVVVVVAAGAAFAVVVGSDPGMAYNPLVVLVDDVGVEVEVVLVEVVDTPAAVDVESSSPPHAATTGTSARETMANRTIRDTTDVRAEARRGLR